MKRLLICFILAATLLGLCSCGQKIDIPPVSEDAAATDDFDCFDLSCQGGYIYHISDDIYDAKIFRTDPDGKVYPLTDNGNFSDMQVEGSYVYVLKSGGFFDTQLKGLWKISVNGDSEERLLSDYLISYYKVASDGSIYFIEYKEDDTDNIVLYRYTDDTEVSVINELPMGSYLYGIYDDLVLYSYGSVEKLCSYDLVTESDETIVELPRGTYCSQLISVDSGFVAITETDNQNSNTQTVLMIDKDKNTEAIRSFDIEDSAYSLDKFDGKLYFLTYDDMLYIYDTAAKEWDFVDIPEETSCVFVKDGELYARLYTEDSHKLVIEKIEL